MQVAKVHTSSQYTHISDPASLDGLDDFLCGLIDELFVDPKVWEEEERDILSDLAKVEEEILNEITDGSATTQEPEVISGAAGLFDRTVEGTSIAGERPSIFEADSDLLNEHILKVKLLSSQLDYRNSELKESLRRIKWLENQLAEKDDQLKFLPELLKRAIDATSYEFELDDLKLKLEFLSSELATANQQLDTIKSGWLGRFALWLSSKRDIDAA